MILELWYWSSWSLSLNILHILNGPGNLILFWQRGNEQREMLYLMLNWTWFFSFFSQLPLLVPQFPSRLFPVKASRSLPRQSPLRRTRNLLRRRKRRRKSRLPLLRKKFCDRMLLQVCNFFWRFLVSGYSIFFLEHNVICLFGLWWIFL